MKSCDTFLVFVIVAFFVIATTLTYGKNPGNITKGNDWMGEVQSEGRFEAFSSNVYAIRAMTKILQSYNMSGYTTIEEIIPRYAPEPKDSINNYIAYVSIASGLEPDEYVDVKDPDVLFRVLKGMIYFENGNNPASDDEIMAGIALALSNGKVLNV